MANPNDTPAPTKPLMAGCQQEPCSALPDLWEEYGSNVWVRATKIVEGELMGLKAEIKKAGTLYYWNTTHPRKFGNATSVEAAIRAVEEFLQNSQDQESR